MAEDYDDKVHPMGPPGAASTMEVALGKESKARALAAYALNLAYAAELEPFEREHLVTIAKEFGADVTPAMQERLARRVERDKWLVAELVRLNQEVARLTAKRRWWPW